MWQKLKITFQKHWLFIGIFLALVIFSLFTYKQYGMSYDEQTQRYIGEKYCSYVFENDTTFYGFLERDHGGIFEMALIGVENLVGSKDETVIYQTRHLVSHLFFLFCCTFMYFLVYRQFKQHYLALVSFIILVLNPRIYAHSFFNSKDIPFLGVSVIILFALYLAVNKGKLWHFVLLGILCGLATSIRFLGLIFPFISLFVLVLKAIACKEKIKFSSLISMFLMFLASIFLFFPTLWHKPIDSLLHVLKSLSVFRWEGHILLNGEKIFSTHLPWYYLPEWIVISNPLSICLLFFIGLFICIYVCKSKWKVYKNEFLFLIALIAIIFTPILMVIVLKSVVYDDWRHVYFIYPTMVLVVVYGIFYIQAKWLKITCCSILLLEIIYSQITLFPYQYVYFNALISKKTENIRHQFDYDYWGVAQKDALNYLIKNCPTDSITIKRATVIGNNLLLLSKENSKRIFLVDTAAKPKYFITTYRNHPQDYNYKLIYQKHVQGSSIYGIYELR